MVTESDDHDGPTGQRVAEKMINFESIYLYNIVGRKKLYYIEKSIIVRSGSAACSKRLFF